MRTKHASRRRSQPILISLLLPLMLMILSSCGGTAAPPPAADQPTAAPAPAAATAAPAPAAATAAPAAEPTAATAADQPTAEAPTAPAAEAPSPIPTPTEGLSTVGTGATKIVWWHISTQKEQRDNWQNLANTFVKDHPDVSIEITVLENEAFKAKLATAMQSGSPPDIFQSWGGGVLKQYADAGLV